MIFNKVQEGILLWKDVLETIIEKSETTSSSENLTVALAMMVSI